MTDEECGSLFLSANKGKEMRKKERKKGRRAEETRMEWAPFRFSFALGLFIACRC